MPHLQKINLKCEACGKESRDWESFVFRWECDWRRKEFRGFGVRCNTPACFPRITADGVIEGWHHAPHFLSPGALAGFLGHLFVMLEAGFALAGPHRAALERHLEVFLREMAGKGVAERKDGGAS
ncbi:hypothetical protein [Desulfovirgula thermocuniculi]|uniref:hypothetical protein n=1 Tax=Desulfovirgula thermocuniculi TaxID=348842 RepID=UPI00040B98E1|nr:hypothetical protein [Desulfovirgula thermocuniculi]